MIHDSRNIGNKFESKLFKQETINRAIITANPTNRESSFFVLKTRPKIPMTGIWKYSRIYQIIANFETFKPRIIPKTVTRNNTFIYLLRRSGQWNILIEQKNAKIIFSLKNHQQNKNLHQAYFVHHWRCKVPIIVQNNGKTA